MKNKIVLFLLVVTVGTVQSTLAEDCNRTCLKTFVDNYFVALKKRDPSHLPVAKNVKYTENSEIMKLGQGLWRTAGDTTYRMEIFDPLTGGIGVVAVMKEAGSQGGDDLTMLMLRLKVEQQKITEIENIIVRKGQSGAVWAPQNLTQVSPSFTFKIRPAEQNSRYEIMAAANGYWRAFETNGTDDYHPAPFLPSANRFENGLQTTNRKLGNFGPFSAAEQFDRGMFRGGKIYDRRYPVVDQELGVVLSIVRFGRQDWLPADQSPSQSGNGANANPLVAEFFAVEAGLIQEINVVMIARPLGSPTNW